MHLNNSGVQPGYPHTQNNIFPHMISDYISFVSILMLFIQNLYELMFKIIFTNFWDTIIIQIIYLKTPLKLY